MGTVLERLLHILPSTYNYGVELVKSDFPVNTTYKPYMKVEDINVQESVEDYYMRSYSVTQYVVRKHTPSEVNILLVGHPGTLDSCTRQLTGKPVRNSEEFRNIVRGCPYCCLCTAMEKPSSGKWSLIEPPIPQLTHGANSKDYCWENLQN